MKTSLPFPAYILQNYGGSFATHAPFGFRRCRPTKEKRSASRAVAYCYLSPIQFRCTWLDNPPIICVRSCCKYNAVCFISAMLLTKKVLSRRLE